VLPAGTRSLKGLTEPVTLFELRRPADGPAKVADPVCGMELDEDTSETQLSWDGGRLLFCSERCLRRFLDHPDRYRG
jgi:YHS domain-containing protein